MQKSIFHNRLEGQLGDRETAKLRRNVCYKVCTVIVTHILELHIKRCVGDLIIDRANKLFLSECQTVKADKCLNRLAYLADLPGSCQPVDHIQGIVEKMRIDLGLQGAEFGFLQFFCSQFLLIQQFIDFSSHKIVGSGEDADFIISGIFQQKRSGTSGTDGFHLQGNMDDAVCKGF